MRELAAKGGVKPAAAVTSLERILGEVGQFGLRLQDQPIRRASVRLILQTVNANVAAILKTH
jgi:hypothetical protein